MAKFTITKVETKWRNYPSTFHKKGFDEYYDYSKVFIKVGDSLTQMNSNEANKFKSEAVNYAFSELSVEPETIVRWSSKLQCFIVKSATKKSRNIFITVKEESENAESQNAATA